MTFFKIVFIFCIIFLGSTISNADPNEQCMASEKCGEGTFFAIDSYKLHKLAILESSFYNDLKVIYFSEKDASTNQHLQRYLEDYEESVIKLLKSSIQPNISSKAEPKDVVNELWAVVTNPLSMYRMIRRLVIQFQKLEQVFSKDSDGFKVIEEFRKSAESLPRESDLFEAVDGLLRLQFAYEFPSYQLSQGIIGEKEINVILNAVHCLEIGKHAMSSYKFTLAIEWLETAEQLAKFNDKQLLSDIENELDIAKKMHDEDWIQLRNVSITQRRFLFKKRVLSQKNSKKRVTVSSIMRNKHFRNRTSYDDVEAMDLCAGYNFQNSKSKLKCWLETKKHPYWRINPLKVELLNEEPELVQIYDFIGDELINGILTATRKYMKRSGVVNQEDGSCKINNDRTSMNAWMDKYENEYFAMKLMKLIELATGLIVQGESNEIQVVEYSALGSHFDFHLDPLEKKELIPEGDRIATVQYYLNDVEMGGYGFTAFPALNLATKPIKGSAVLWYNILSSGVVDIRSYHGGCPLSLGIKKIANHWIYSHDQMFNRKCGLTKDASFYKHF